MTYYSRLVGSGSYLPEKVLTNHQLAELVDTSDEWITSRTGIKERRIAAETQFTSDLGAEAARRAMKKAGFTAEQIDLIIGATITPDMPDTAKAGKPISASISCPMHSAERAGWSATA